MDAHHLLRSARLARGISLEHVMTETRMSPRVVHALDEGRFSELPGGIYARSFLRMFARVVGLDADTVEQVAPLLPEPADPIPVIREIVVRQSELEARRRRRTLRLCAAAAVDAVVLLGIEAVAVGCAARIAGATGAAVANASVVPLAMLFVALASIYFLLPGITGTTIGAYLCKVELLAHAPRLDLMLIVRRAARACLLEASILLMVDRATVRPS